MNDSLQDEQLSRNTGQEFEYHVIGYTAEVAARRLSRDRNQSGNFHRIKAIESMCVDGSRWPWLESSSRHALCNEWSHVVYIGVSALDFARSSARNLLSSGDGYHQVKSMILGADETQEALHLKKAMLRA